MMAERTAQESAAFLLPHLRSGMRVLDVGCGPGSITIGLAEAVAPGHVVGIDIEESQVQYARELAARKGVANVEFDAADVYDLPYESASFDVVFMSAVFGNLREPERATAEIHRALKMGGLVAVREFDHGSNFTWPPNELRNQSEDLYLRLRKSYGHDATCGRQLRAILERAGFQRVSVRAVCQSAGDKESTTEWGQSTAILLQESFLDRFVENGWIEKHAASELLDAWNDFGNEQGAFVMSLWVEGIGWRSSS